MLLSMPETSKDQSKCARTRHASAASNPSNNTDVLKIDSQCVQGPLCDKGLNDIHEGGVQ